VAGKAFTRAVSPKLADCALTHQQRVAIDAEIACEQHDAYENALRDAGLQVIRLPELPEHPDGVFVEDTALLLGEHAIITRPGSHSRAAETESTAEGLRPHFQLHRLETGHLDGGDVLRIGKTLHVGRSSRTDRDGAAALKHVASTLGFEVVVAEVRNCLHLKTAATLAGHDRNGALVLLYNPAGVDPGQFSSVTPLAVEADETAAANLLCVGGPVIMPLGNVKTANRLRQRGFDVVELDVSELEKAEAGVTCMSLVSARCEES
jgi:dimethylargininase